MQSPVAATGRWRRAALRVALAAIALELGLRGFVGWVHPAGRLLRNGFRPSAEVGWVMAPGVSRVTDWPPLQLHFTVDTNALGLRGAEVPAKAPGELRALVLGDSFVFGIGVESSETFPSVLQATWRARTSRRVTVVNAGVPSYGTREELGLYRAWGERFAPDLVLLAHYPNDEEDAVTRFVWADGYLFSNPVVLLGGHPSFLLELVHKLLPRQPYDQGQGQRLVLEALGALRRETAARGQAFFVVQLPDRPSTRFALPDEPHVGHRALQFGPGLIDVYPPIAESAENPYLLEHHFNPLGHRLTAQAIDRALGQQLGEGWLDTLQARAP
ncbi:MAG: hypothetical protein IPJ65_10335 [Archangiaceae bacterium]|nr:hypothetical protein [Archangiaceae bacterium]